MMNKIYRTTALIILSISLLIFTGCSNPFLEKLENVEQADGSIKVKITIPDFKAIREKQLDSRIIDPSTQAIALLISNGQGGYNLHQELSLSDGTSVDYPGDYSSNNINTSWSGTFTGIPAGTYAVDDLLFELRDSIGGNVLVSGANTTALNLIPGITVENLIIHCLPENFTELNSGNSYTLTGQNVDADKLVYFSFQALAGSSYTAEITKTSGTGFPDLYILNSLGEIVENDIYTSGTLSITSSVYEADEMIYFSVYGSGGTAEFTISGTEDNANTESGLTFDDPIPLVIDESKNGIVNSSGTNELWYSVELSNPGELTIDTTGGIHFRLYYPDGTGTNIYAVTSGEATYTADFTAGTYYFKLFSRYNDSSDYNFTITPSFTADALYTDDEDPDNITGPQNDVQASAYSMSIDEAKEGYIGYTNDLYTKDLEDWYSVELFSPGELTINTTGGIHFQYYQPNGTAGDYAVTTGDASYTANFTAGISYFRVIPKDNYTAYNYTITASFTAAALYPDDEDPDNVTAPQNDVLASAYTMNIDETKEGYLGYTNDMNIEDLKDWYSIELTTVTTLNISTTGGIHFQNYDSNGNEGDYAVTTGEASYSAEFSTGLHYFKVIPMFSGSTHTYSFTIGSEASPVLAPVVKTIVNNGTQIGENAMAESDGNLLVAYYDSSGYHLAGIHSTDGGENWSAPFVIDESSLNIGAYISIESDATGFYVSYLDYTNDVAKFVKVDSSGNPGTPVVIGNSGTYTSQTAVTVSGDDVYFFYKNYNMSGTDAYMLSRSTNKGVSWSEPTVIMQVNTGFDGTTITSLGSDMAAVSTDSAIFASVFASGDLRLITSTDNGSTWSFISGIDDYGMQYSSITASGATILVTASDYASDSIEAWISTNSGSTWTQLTVASTGVALQYGSAVIDGSTMYVPFKSDSTDSNTLKLAKSADNGVNWSEATIDSINTSYYNRAAFYNGNICIIYQPNDRLSLKFARSNDGVNW